MRKNNAVVLTEIISPYRIPTFNILAEDPEITLKVLFFSETEARRKWRVPKEKVKFNYKVLRGMVVRKSRHNDSIFFNPSVISELIKEPCDTIMVGGFHHPTIWMAFFYALLTHKRFILHSESTLRDKRSNNKAKEWMKRFFVRRCSGYVVPGVSQRRYLTSLGAEEGRIWTAPNSVETEIFRDAAEALQSEKGEIRKALGLTEDVILYVGRMVDEKGVPDLIDAFEIISRLMPSANLVLVGDGPDEAKYKQLCRQRNIKKVFFLGFQQRENLPRYYAIANVFVFPTHSDPWGLVINEAMLAGLPVVCSRSAGAAEDLIRHEQNGFVYDPGDVKSMAGYISRLLKNTELAKQMGQYSRAIIANYMPEDMAAGIKDAILEKKGAI